MDEGKQNGASHLIEAFKANRPYLAALHFDSLELQLQLIANHAFAPSLLR